MTMYMVSMIADGMVYLFYCSMTLSDDILGQVQAAVTHTMMAVSQIADGQIQATGPASTAPAVSQIADGQIQATAPVSTAPAVSQIADGQIQATQPASTASAVSQIADGQIQATAPASTASAVSQIGDGQIQATASAVSQISDRQPQASRRAFIEERQSNVMVTCQSNDTLTLTLNNGVLKDGKGRTGYIAANRQFQFDDPPQTGAVFTAGFSVLNNGSLVLGDSAIFYQCLSGSFYNLYDRNTAPQCNPVTVSVLTLQTC